MDIKKLKSWFCIVCFIFASILVKSQTIDVSKSVADSKTYLFDDGKTTVKDYVYDYLSSKCDCCGKDRIYIEIKVGYEAYPISAKALTGKNDCFKESIADIVKNIKWDNEEFKGPKSLFIEFKPDISCEGKKNQYRQVKVFNNPILTKKGQLKKSKQKLYLRYFDKKCSIIG